MTRDGRPLRVGADAAVPDASARGLLASHQGSYMSGPVVQVMGGMTVF